MRVGLAAKFVALSIIPLAVSAYAAYYCQPFTDEGHYSDPAYNLSHYGFLGTTFTENIGTGLTRQDQHTYSFMPLYMVGQAAWMLIFPSSLFSVRLFSVCWMLVSIGAIYILTRGIGFNVTAALITTFVYSTNFSLMDISKDARPDLMCQALGWSGLAAYAALRQRSLTKALIAANVFVAASGLTHPNGLLYLAGLTVLVLYLDRSRLQWIHAAAVVGVYAVAAAGWGAYILRDPHAFLDQFRTEASIHKVPLSLRVFWNEIRQRYIPVFGLESPYPASKLKGLVLLSYLAAIIAALLIRPLRQSRQVKTLLALLAAVFVTQSVFNAKYLAYFVHIVPLYCALLGYVVWHFWSDAPRSRPLLILGIGGLALLQIGFIVGKTRAISRGDELRDLRLFLANNEAPARLIFVDAALLHTFGYDHRFLDDRYFGVRSGKRADVIIEVRYLSDNLYGFLKQVRRGDWERIQARLSEYRPVLETPGYRVLIPKLDSPLSKGLAGPSSINPQ